MPARSSNFRASENRSRPTPATTVKEENRIMVKSNVPAPVIGPGFNGPSLLAENTILGKWDSDAGWHDRDGLPMPSPVIALGTRRGVRRWKDHELIDEIVDLPLPDVAALNAAIPKSEWEIGLSGEPTPPYSMWFAGYLLDPITGTVFSYLNNTTGCEIAIGRLESSMTWMRAMRGPVFPVCKLGDAPMKTRFGMKRRPNFVIVDWRGAGGTMIGSPETVPQIGVKVEEPSTKGAINDEMPPWDDDISDVGR